MQRKNLVMLTTNYQLIINCKRLNMFSTCLCILYYVNYFIYEILCTVRTFRTSASLDRYSVPKQTPIYVWNNRKINTHTDIVKKQELPFY